MFKNVLVPLDGSEVSEQALKYASEIVDPEGGRLTLLMAIDIPERVAVAYYPGIVSIANDDDLVHDKLVPQAEEYLARQVESLHHLGFKVEPMTVVDDAATAIVDRAEELDVDAIVMSTHGRSGLSRWLFGSVTGKVLSVATRPVFVVPVRGK
jgi:nucleotide-binding universal stress UspA family protein